MTAPNKGLPFLTLRAVADWSAIDRRHAVAMATPRRPPPPLPPSHRPTAASHWPPPHSIRATGRRPGPTPAAGVDHAPSSLRRARAPSTRRRFVPKKKHFTETRPALWRLLLFSSIPRLYRVDYFFWGFFFYRVFFFSFLVSFFFYLVGKHRRRHAPSTP